MLLDRAARLSLALGPQRWLPERYPTHSTRGFAVHRGRGRRGGKLLVGRLVTLLWSTRYLVSGKIYDSCR